MYELKAKKMIEQFLLEDIGERDITCSSLFEEGARGYGCFLVKADGVIAGLQIIKWVYELLGDEVEVIYFKKDGDKVCKDDVIAEVKGSIATLLTAERVILNLMQRMSGIATMTNKAVTLLDSTSTKICDTRKTMPGLRMFDKYSVRCGGGYNHRFGLYDTVMLKDNHIEYAGGIIPAVKKVRQALGHTVKIEVEIETITQLHEAIEANVDIIMFDNRSSSEIQAWMEYVPSHIMTEASGGIGLHNLHTYKDSGVHYISLGALTHSVVALDISFNVENE